MRRGEKSIPPNSLVQLLKGLLPRGLKEALAEFTRPYPARDHSRVALYAAPSILPGYSPRVDLDEALAAPARQIKVSLITTTLNEAARLRPWMESILAQSRKPDEIVIVDGGSTDGTLEALHKYALTAKIPMRVIQASGANIARGRNTAIQNAVHEVIACTDGGCVLDQDWLRLLATPFEADPEIQASAGFYGIVASDRFFERVCVRSFIPALQAVNPQTFLPSGRSLAMTKSLWRAAGGYPEWLSDAGEDTLFDLQAKRQPERWAFVPQALAYWRMPDSLGKLYKTHFRYARGDGEVGMQAGYYVSKAKRLALLVLLAAAALVMIGLLALWEPLWSGICLSGLAFFALLGAVYQARRISYRLGVLLTEALAHILMTGFVSVAQVAGFTSGVMNRGRVEERRAEFYRAQLQRILTAHPDRRGVVVYPPTHDWGFMFQLPQQMARAFARRGYLYFYCTRNESTDIVEGFQEVEPGLVVCNVPLQTFNKTPGLIAYIGSPWLSGAPEKLGAAKVIYDHYDDLEVSSGRVGDHQALLKRADVVAVTAQRLLDDVSQLRPDAILAPNGVDYERIQSLRPQPGQPAPADLQSILERGKPLVGYSGSLARRFDYDLMACLAASRPQYEFVLVGVDYDGTLPASGLLHKGLDNLHWLGMKGHDELFSYVWRFDAGLIPFKINKTTQATTSIKLFEYMACQTPVVSTAMPESKKYPGVFIAETCEEFACLVDEALKAKNDPAYLELIYRVAREHTWDTRAEKIINAIAQNSALPNFEQ